MVNYFIKYIRGRGAEKNPSDFYITLDGTSGTYWTCYSTSMCQPGSAKEDIKDCERKTGKKEVSKRGPCMTIFTSDDRTYLIVVPTSDLK